ncbi:hypothetical protein K491DRAFT_255525 [Lophiostoma macrostomum CBS 122681]|uniref:Uncharacterized protein n=1 Tax=Lophiostoma macrostomum CBS 122681 TaxID=1314788 RepID=A0A6A6SML1_9PLEO|nr:hypothetical protein K491DRAFT_255525 [Lophiostoma macrostomum CBS 122681]
MLYISVLYTCFSFPTASVFPHLQSPTKHHTISTHKHIDRFTMGQHPSAPQPTPTPTPTHNSGPAICHVGGVDYRCDTPRLAIRGDSDHDHAEMVRDIMFRLVSSFVVLSIIFGAAMIWRRRRLIWNCEDDREEDEERRILL